jgi:uncharacterized RDD family membrane protein YckC
MTVSVSSPRRRASYEPEDGSYRAVAAPLWRRGVASTVDWVLVFVVYLIAGIPLGVFQSLGEALTGPVGETLFWLTQAAALAIVGGYFAYFFSTGHTMGMRALDIHVFAHRSGRDPSLPRAAVRGLIALAFFLGTINGYGLVRGKQNEALTSSEEMVKTLCVVGISIAILGELWQLVDPDGRTVWDRLTGLVVVEDVVPTSMPDRLWTPWGT